MTRTNAREIACHLVYEMYLNDVTAEGFPEILAEWRAKKLGSRAAAERLGVSQTTFLKWAKAENLPKK